MGACSSKPKTTEFEGSTEPSKETEGVAVDQAPAQERSLETLVDEHHKEVPTKAGEKEREGAHPSTETVQTTRELNESKDEGPKNGVLPSSAEGNLEAQSVIPGEKIAVNNDGKDEVEPTEKVGDIVTDEVVQKVDVGSGATDNASTNINGAKDTLDGSVVDEGKACKDKAVVLEETGSSQGDASYVDKTVAVDEEKAPETPGKRNIILPEEEASSSVLESAESPGVESPITGVVQPVEQMEEYVSKTVDTESEKDGGNVPAHAHVHFKDDPKVVGEISSEGNEASGVEILAPASGVETLPLASTVETLAPAEADLSQPGSEEGTSQPQAQAPSVGVDTVTLTTIDSEIDSKACPTDATLGAPHDESVVNHIEDSHATTAGDGGSAASLETETPKTSECIDSEVSTIHPKVEDAPEKSSKEHSELIVDASNGKTQPLAAQEDVEHGKQKATLDESVSDRQEKAKHAQAATGEDGKETAEKPHLDHKTSGDVGFEDASDAPLKLETTNSIEPGQVPS